MPRHALSQTKSAQIDSELYDQYVTIAVDLYLDQPDVPKKDRLGLRDVCKEAARQCFLDTGKEIKVSKTTVSEHAKGRKSIREFNAAKGWLDSGEEEMVVDFAIDTALRGFPLNHRRLKEHVDALCREKYGSGGEFLADGVGKDWTNRFVERHSARLHPYWSRSLDHSRARAINPTNIDTYFKLLESTIKGAGDEAPIEEACIYGMDETGLQLGVAMRERVIGPSGRKVQYQQRSGDRENVTVLVTICADGTSLSPAVIFKGEGYHPNWDQENPLNASLGHSKKGYTDGDIGVEWIKLFNRQTDAKAQGRRRLLLVDGHSSHYTFGFLDFARKHRIHVLCYPSHTTHFLQGLDVVIFGSLKQHWRDARDAYESRAQKVNKTNFLSVYYTAHTNALTRDNILAAFRKTGVVPFNPSIIPPDAILPSLETSCKGSLPLLPPLQTSPIRIVSRMIFDEMAAQRRPASTSSPVTPPSLQYLNPQPHPSNVTPATPTTPRRPHNAGDVVNMLTSTSAAYLVSPTPISSKSDPPRYIPAPISPLKRHIDDLLEEPAETDREERMQDALRDANTRDHRQKKTLSEMQGAVILSGMYVTRVQEKLQAYDAKEGKGKRKMKLLGDGLPKLLDGDDFHSKVVEHTARQGEEKAAKRRRKVDRERYRKEVETWRVVDYQRTDRVKVARAEHKEKVAAYQAEVKRAKQEHRDPELRRPEFHLEPRLPKPKLKDMKAQDTDEDEDELSENGTDGEQTDL